MRDVIIKAKFGMSEQLVVAQSIKVIKIEKVLQIFSPNPAIVGETWLEKPNLDAFRAQISVK